MPRIDTIQKFALHLSWKEARWLRGMCQNAFGAESDDARAIRHSVFHGLTQALGSSPDSAPCQDQRPFPDRPAQWASGFMTQYGIQFFDGPDTLEQMLAGEPPEGPPGATAYIFNLSSPAPDLPGADIEGRHRPTHVWHPTSRQWSAMPS